MATYIKAAELPGLDPDQILFVGQPRLRLHRREVGRHANRVRRSPQPAVRRAVAAGHPGSHDEGSGGRDRLITSAMRGGFKPCSSHGPRAVRISHIRKYRDRARESRTRSPTTAFRCRKPDIASAGRIVRGAAPIYPCPRPSSDLREIASPSVERAHSGIAG